jgi:hypothetical protein
MNTLDSPPTGAVPRRITEPFVKGRFALWLADHGAVEIDVSVDGAESDADEIRRMLAEGGFDFEPSIRTRTSYAGIYRRAGQIVKVSPQPGADIIAMMSDGRRLLAEAKGERTVAGVRSGTDWSGFCEVLGQLLMAVGKVETTADVAALLLPKTPRVTGFAKEASCNRLLKRIPVVIALVDHVGRVMTTNDVAFALTTVTS